MNTAFLIFHLPAIYGRNFKPKIFTDIKMPAKQSYGPNIWINLCGKYQTKQNPFLGGGWVECKLS